MMANFRNSSGRLLLSAIFILFLTAACSGNESIEGKVKDIFGNPLAEVSVSIEKAAYKANTNQSGAYALDFAPGQFVVIFSKAGYAENRLELNLHQKVKFLAEDVLLYPRPDKSGIYYVDRAAKQLVEIQKNSEIRAEEQSTGFMEAHVKFRVAAVQGKEWPRVKAGKAEFIDTTASLSLLNRLDSSWVINEAKRNPMGARVIYLIAPKESVTKVGSEGVLLRAFTVEPGYFVFAPYYDNAIMGQRVPKDKALGMTITVRE